MSVLTALTLKGAFSSINVELVLSHKVWFILPNNCVDVSCSSRINPPVTFKYYIEHYLAAFLHVLCLGMMKILKIWRCYFSCLYKELKYPRLFVRWVLCGLNVPVSRVAITDYCLSFSEMSCHAQAYPSHSLPLIINLSISWSYRHSALCRGEGYRESVLPSFSHKECVFWWV